MNCYGIPGSMYGHVCMFSVFSNLRFFVKFIHYFSTSALSLQNLCQSILSFKFKICTYIHKYIILKYWLFKIILQLSIFIFMSKDVPSYIHTSIHMYVNVQYNYMQVCMQSSYTQSYSKCYLVDPYCPAWTPVAKITFCTIYNLLLRRVKSGAGTNRSSKHSHSLML